MLLGHFDDSNTVSRLSAQNELGVEEFGERSLSLPVGVMFPRSQVFGGSRFYDQVSTILA
jgi:hypothetical protein